MTNRKRSNAINKKTKLSPAKSRLTPVERLEFVGGGLKEGKSGRQMARELGCDEGTIRHDIKKLSLPEDEQAAIQNSDSAEKYLRQARFEKTRIGEIAVRKKKKRLVKEEKTGSDDLAELVLDWLTRKRLDTSGEEIRLLETVKAANKQLTDRQGPPTINPGREFALCERGMAPHYR